MRLWEKIFYDSLDRKKTLHDILRQVTAKLDISIKDLAKQAGIPKSSLYKIMSGERRDPLMSTILNLIRTVRQIEEGQNKNGNFIAVITTRPFLEDLNRFKIKKKNLFLKGYPAADIEEGLIQGICAERDNAKAIVCGPITAHTLEKIVKIPVISLRVEDIQINNAIKKAIQNINI